MSNKNILRNQAMQEYKHNHPDATVGQVAQIFGVSWELADYWLRLYRKHLKPVGRPPRDGQRSQ